MSVPLGTPGRALSILSCLSHLMGSRSTGTALVKSTDPTGSLPPGVFGFPVVGAGGSTLDWTKPIRTVQSVAGPTNEPTATALTDAGVSIPIFSVLGGVGQNFAAGTKIMWFPTREGVEAYSVVEDPGMTGSAAESGIFAVKSLTWYEDPQTTNFAADVIRAAQSNSPGIILSWANAPEMTPIRGPKKYDRRDRWSLDVIVSRQESHHTRGLQGMGIVDLIVTELTDRCSVDGIPFTSPGIRILGVARYSVDPGFYVYRITAETAVTIWGTDDTRRAVAADWARTKYTYPTPSDETGGHPGQLDVAGPATYPQPT